MGENIDSKAYLNAIRDSLTGSLLSKRATGAKQSGTPVMRTDSDDLAERPVTVVFGIGDNAREFLIYTKPHLEADEWRVAAVQVLNAARPVLMSDLSSGELSEVLNSAESILNLANILIMGAIPAITELVFCWEPSLDRDHILRELGATDAQIATAFVGCLQLAFPFNSTLRQVGRLIQGSQSKSNSPTNPTAETGTRK